MGDHFIYLLSQKEYETIKRQSFKLLDQWKKNKGPNRHVDNLTTGFLISFFFC